MVKGKQTDLEGTTTYYGEKQIPARYLKHIRGKSYQDRRTGKFVSWNSVKYTIGSSKAYGSFAQPRVQKSITTIMNSQGVSEQEAKDRMHEFLTKYYAGEIEQEDFTEIIYGMVV